MPKVKEAFKQQGFGTLTEIDVRTTLKEKLVLEMEDYVILGACNPQLAHRALDIDRDIGLLLLGNVVVRRHDGRTLVQALDPAIMVSARHSDGATREPPRRRGQPAHRRRPVAC